MGLYFQVSFFFFGKEVEIYGIWQEFEVLDFFFILVMEVEIWVLQEVGS